MRKRSSLIALAVVAALAVAVPVTAGDGVYMGYRFSDDFSQDYKVKFNQELDFGGFAMSVFVDMEVTEKCVAVNDTAFVMEMHFKKVEAGTMQFDNMQENPMGENLTGQAITYTLKADGETGEIKQMGYIEGWDQARQMVQQIVEFWYPNMPDREVASGEEWTRDAPGEEENGMTISGTSTYKFEETKKEKGRECAKIAARQEMLMSGKQQTGMGPMNAEGTVEGNGEFYFDSAGSIIVKYKAKAEVKMDMTPEAGGDAVKTTINFSMDREIL